MPKKVRPQLAFYNYLNQNTKVTDPLNGYTTYTYNLVGAVTESVDKLGVINTFNYDAKGSLLSKSASKDGETQSGRQKGTVLRPHL